MEAASLFLEKFRHLEKPDAKLKQAAIAAILKVIKVVVTPGQLKLSGGVLYLKLPPIIKSELMIHREQILAEMGRQLSRPAPGRLV